MTAPPVYKPTFKNYTGFVIFADELNKIFKVYEPIAVAYLDGKNYPPEEFVLKDDFHSIEEASTYIRCTLIASFTEIEEGTPENYENQ